MVNQYIWIGIVITAFFVGIGASYAHFANTYDPMSMKFQNQELFNQMMSNNPRMSQQWMDSGMMNQQQMMNDPQLMNQWMNAMMNDPQAMQQMHDMMMSNPQYMNQMMGPMMNTMMNDPEMQQQMMNHMMGNQGMMNSMMNNQQMMNMMGGSMMMGSDMMGGMMMGGMSTSPSSASVSGLQTSAEPQTRTFDIILDEVKFYAEVENEEGIEEIAFVELHQWNPNLIVVNEGDTIILNISNPRKHTHTFSIPELGINTEVLEARTGSETIQFVADKPGMFTFACGLSYNTAAGQCDPDHSMMSGTLIVLG
ncbi:MAG: cupredoxin domain-containing protein [Nitrosopumilus sp.]|uniref:cupredoxin domain-containing protein n=1 Tax=Nitrosopumilus sp. TaxID=2024843 RepID=UPI00242A54DC|nr:cupredoxin domain-containing protein [Nitrosopumilus sp.]MCV0367324.1 cupredoxin domain-containing protein [Nitrosopumilus sp.]